MRPAVIGHRGASGDAPENTMAAFRAAWASGADAIETDVRITRDGWVVAHHDPSLRRTAGISAAVAELDWADLSLIDVGSWKSPHFADENVPSLSQILQEMPSTGRIFIEIKVGVEILPALEATFTVAPIHPDQAVLISFGRDVLAAAKQRFPNFECAWILDSPRSMGTPTLTEAIKIAQGLQFDGLDLSAKWEPAAAVHEIHAAAMRCYTWTVNTPDAARRWADADVDGITTDYPAKILSTLGRPI